MMKSDNLNLPGKEKTAGILKIYLLMSIMAVVVFASMFYILFTGRNMTAVNTPLVDAAMEIKLEATMGHLWLEEIIRDDSNESLKSSLSHIDNALWYADAMLKGGENSEGKFTPLKNAHLQKQITLVREKLELFRDLTQKRWDEKAASDRGSDIDLQYDQVYKEFMKLADEVETELQFILNAGLKRFQIIQSLLIVLCLFGFIVVGLILRRHLRAQLRDEMKLMALNQQLDASNQQLRASNQQMDALNQQLNAANQQLQANENALRDSGRKYRDIARSLKASENFLNATNQTARVGGWEFDTETHELRMTREINRIYEIPVDYKPTLEEAFSFLHPEDRHLLEGAISNSIESGEPYDIEFRIITAGGDVKWANGRGKPEIVNGKAVKMSGTFQDITQRKYSEFEREELIRTLACKNDELQSIVYISSHDLKSPLVNINGFSGSLAESCQQITRFIEKLEIDEDLKNEILPVVSEEIPESLNFILSSGKRMSKLIDGLLRVSRIGTCDVDFKKIDMNKVISNIEDNIKFKVDSIGTELIYGDLPTCTGDEDQVTQLFANLVDNSLKYLDPDRKGLINFSGQRKEGKSFYYVEDNGIGIAEAHLNKIFSIFHRLDPEGPVEGEGLGLTIVRRIIDRHNGDIYVESKAGIGTKFTVILPG